MPLLTFSEKGIYCPAGDFYIDPWKPVDSAVVTHAHSDHARKGHRFYLAHHRSAPVLRLRLGHGIALQTVEYGQVVLINGVRVTLHPAGHIIGSAQVRVEHKGEVWVVSGDYKLENDGISGAFDPVRCHTFISECTFGLPVYRWEPQEVVFSSINEWWRQNLAQGKSSVLVAYSLGKAQRVAAGLDFTIGPVYAHGATWNVQEALREETPALAPLERVDPRLPRSHYKAAMVLAPQSAMGSSWLKRFEPYALGLCSGWCRVQGQVRRRNADRGFVLSDHADWPGLIQAIQATGAEKVYMTHGFTEVTAKYLREALGIEAGVVSTQFGEEAE